MDEMLKDLQTMHFWYCGARCLENEDAAKSYVRNISDFSIPSLKSTRELVVEAYERAQTAKAVEKAICGNKKGEKRTAALARRFEDVERIDYIFTSVHQTLDAAPMVLKAIDHELAHRKPAVMPEGRLLSFSSSASNGFAGWRKELSLKRNADGQGGTLNLKEENHRHFEPDGPAPTDITVEVGDSVFQRVRDMVENGKFYEIAKSYQPDIPITDASSWSLYMKFEKGSISSSGYAAGPDHSDVLRAIEEYLESIIQP
jgi:hypothetical protein